jgi:hypothetical protein
MQHSCTVGFSFDFENNICYNRIIMKVVKLNRRYKAYKEGFTHALRLISWSKEAGEIEQFLTTRYGSQYNWYTQPGNRQWSSGFGHRSSKYDTRPFWINLRNESDITMILLSGNYKIKA